jgi:hypothetical protein
MNIYLSKISNVFLLSLHCHACCFSFKQYTIQIQNVCIHVQFRVFANNTLHVCNGITYLRHKQKLWLSLNPNAIKSGYKTSQLTFTTSSIYIYKTNREYTVFNCISLRINYNNTPLIRPNLPNTTLLSGQISDALK